MHWRIGGTLQQAMLLRHRRRLDQPAKADTVDEELC